MVDGIIYGGFNTDISHFQNIDIPAVTIGRKVSPLIPVIQADNLMAGKLAYSHLAAKDAISMNFIGLPVIMFTLIIILNLFYTLDKKYPQIKADLEARRAQVESPAA